MEGEIIQHIIYRTAWNNIGKVDISVLDLSEHQKVILAKTEKMVWGIKENKKS